MLSRLVSSPLGHRGLLVLVWSVLFLPNLGTPGLWDIDEGNNAECAFEMWRSGNLLVPTFNYHMRFDKPALLYWCQAAAYDLFGVNEFAARLPSALAALVTLLVTYELGRQMFGRTAGLLSGLVLAAAPLFVAAGHFANPDALLLGTSTAGMLLFWHDYRRNGAGWLALTGVTTGLAVMAKGPVGIAVPMAIVGLFLIWERQYRRLLDPRWITAGVLFLLVGGTWYIWVAVDTKGVWVKRFLLDHNVGRFLGWLMGYPGPMENHGGPPFYFVPILIAGLAPWSVFAGVIGWHVWKTLHTPPSPTEEDGLPHPERSAVRLLTIWFAIYFVAFSVSSTKLPNYVLPLYPAAAILSGWWLDRWRQGQAEVAGWLIRAGLALVAVLGLIAIVGMFVASGQLAVPGIRRVYPTLGSWVWLGEFLIVGAVAGWWCLSRGRRNGMIAAVAVAGIGFSAALAGWGCLAVDGLKSPRALAAALPADQLYRDVRLASFQYFQPSLVFYCQREVRQLEEEKDVRVFLQGPLPSYLFVAADVWERVGPRLDVRCREVARHHDLYDGHEIVVVTNEPAAPGVATLRR
jgi:4-amino-4-deoxy-L-arabinose transferase-like glycosyltransferase